MSAARSIILLGFMGSGKSAVARSLSRRVALPFVDLDARIEREIGSSIADFFASAGEAAFRQIETRLLETAIAEKAVISPGGGAAAQPQNREVLRQAARNGALVVYLQATAQTLAARIRLAPGKRPLIDGGGILDEAATRARVEELLAARENWYQECANLVVSTDEKAILEVAKAIETAWRAPTRCP